MKLYVPQLLLNPAFMLSCISWIRTPTAPGAGGAWLSEISGNPGPQLSPWGVFPPFAHCRSLPTRKNCLLCQVQNRSLRSNCMGIFPHETNPTTSRARQGMSERVQARQGDLQSTGPHFRGSCLSIRAKWHRGVPCS